MPFHQPREPRAGELTSPSPHPTPRFCGGNGEVVKAATILPSITEGKGYTRGQVTAALEEVISQEKQGSTEP